MGYKGAYSSLTEYLRLIRPAAPRQFERRFETAPGQQAQVDFAEFQVEFAVEPGILRKVWLFSMVLGHSRWLWGRFCPNQTLETVMRCHIINAFLALMDEIARAPGVLVVATCNHIELIDPAVLRPGRFDLRVEVPLPDAATLAGVLRRHLALPEAEVSALARHCVGLSLAECDAELRAARGAARRAGVALDAAGLMARLGAGRDPAIDRRVALHEWDNSAMESFFSTLKTERTASKVYRTRNEARADVFDYIERFYNPRRRHSKLGYISPMEFEARAMLA